MARLERTEVKKREDYVRSMFVAEPGLSMTKANDKLHEKFKARMRPQRVYELRKEVQDQLAKFHRANQQIQIQSKPDDINVAARNGQRFQKMEEATARASLLNVGTGNEEIAKQVIDGLKKNGLFQGRIEHAFNGYLVVVNA